MTTPTITDYIQFLSDPASFPEPTGSVQLVQTHISVVAITDKFVYKLKKPVLFDFLDFSTLEKRMFYCAEELRLNRRLSPEIYVGMVPLYRDGGQLQFEQSGEVIDYVIKMHRLSEDRMLVNLIKDPEFKPETLDPLVTKLRLFYQELLESAGENQYGNRANIQHTLEEIAHGFDLIPSCGLPEIVGKLLSDYLFDFIEDHSALFAKRVQQRKIVEGHGDLRSEHIHLTDTEVTIYDCLEFDEKLRSVDWLCDIAFLLMDLDYRHRHDLALHLEQSMTRELEPQECSSLLTFYKTYRACVRGKVNGLKSTESEVPTSIREESRGKARRYYQLALRYALLGAQPTLIVCMGGVASGKSTLAKQLALWLDLTHINSDHVRKHKAGIDPFTRLPDVERGRLYTPETTEQVYETMYQMAVDELQNKGSVLLDGTYRDKQHLQKLVERCEIGGIQLRIIHTSAPEEIIRKRLKGRETEQSASDMRLSDYRLGSFEIGYDLRKIHEQLVSVTTDQGVEVLLTETVIPWLGKKTNLPE